ncbi:MULTISPECIES: Uma2 family endonuclease [Bacillus]|uniref:Uma2 family endonuclease n=1 Tax=Bacillus TaxID=1386 RepID=UPI000BB71987|nr:MULTISPECIES: Uma2 family endonuclease [Bacillus]
MSLPQSKKVSLQEFYLQRERTEELLEYIDGFIFMSPSPSTKHQRISGKLHAKLFSHLNGSGCEVFSAPYDIELQREKVEGTKIVIPDLSVICEKEGFQENKYVGVPSVIIEILSPSNQSHDLVTKLNIYMQYGVKEYWIVNPMLNAVQIYALDTEGNYQQISILKEKGTIHSSLLNDFKVELDELFT